MSPVSKASKHIRTLTAFLMLLSSAFILYGCGNSEENVESELTEDMTVTSDTHHWYSFTREGFEEIQLPRFAQKPAVKPWTEAARISSAAASSERAFFTANRRGILIVDSNGTLTLKTDIRFFPEETTGSLFLDEGNPVFHVYRNSIFNTGSTAHDVAMPFLAEYNLITDIFYPVLYRDDFGMTDTQEVTSITVQDDKLFLSIKDSGKKTTFDYYRVIIPSTYTETASSAHIRTLDGTQIDQKVFQDESSPLSFQEAPARLKELLKAIPSSVKYSIVYQIQDNRNTSKTYLHGFTADMTDSDVTNAYAMAGSSWTAALFPDGTVYFQGALPDSYLLSDGKPVYFTMPVLPKGFIWTMFAISGDILTAGWEETGVYKTGAAGFITVDLKKVLY